MADVVTRLVVESKEYDSKIARATSGLTQFEKKCREVGGTLEFVEKEDLDFVKGLGQMETVSSSAVGSLSELKKAFTELSVQYQNLTDAEKQSPYGQALAGSLDQIKGRIGELGGQLGEVGKEMQASGGFIDKFADSLGQLGPAGQMAGKLLKGAFGPVGIAIAAVVGVIHQLVEAFKRNENAMASAERAAAPFKAIWQQIQRLFDKLVPYIAEGMEKIANVMSGVFNKFTGWIEKLGNTAIGKKLGLDKVAEQMKNVTAAQNELTASNKRIADTENQLNSIRRNTKEANAVSSNKISNLRYKASDKTNYSASERVGFLEEAMKEEEKILKRNLELRKKEYELIKLKNSLTQSGTEDLNEQTDAFVALQQAEQQYNEGMRSLQRQYQVARNEASKEAEANAPAPEVDASGAVEVPIKFNSEGIAAIKKQLSEALSGATIGGEDYLIATEKMADFKAFENLLKTAIDAGIDPSMFEGKFEALKTGIEIKDEDWELFVESINEKLEELDLPPIKLNVDTGAVDQLDQEVTKTIDHVGGAAQAFSALGNAMNQIEDPGAKVAGMVAQAIGSVAAGYGAATAQAATMGPWAWIAFAVTGLATMISTIAGIKQATAGSYASGGIIPGNSYSGDNLTANVNSGELILNRAQQESVASQLQNNNPIGNISIEGRISGTDILLAANNSNRSRGGSRGYYANVK